MNACLNQYQSNQIATASPEQILIMLYDGAIRFTALAAQAIARKDMTGKSHNINRAFAIIAELSGTLDHKINGDLAGDLESLYDFMMRELTRGNIRNDQKPLTAVQNLLKDLRETWMQAIELNRKEVHGVSKTESSAQFAQINATR